MKNLILLCAATCLFQACSKSHSKGQAPQISSAPEATPLPAPLVRAFEELPTEASLELKPWADSYWPSMQGGISYRWNEAPQVKEGARINYSLREDPGTADIARLSPSEKYDLYRGRYDFPTTQDERERTQVLRSIKGSDSFDPQFKIPSWIGLCHAWALAALNFEEPGPVTLSSREGLEIPFASSDIKALLMYFIDKTMDMKRTSMVGGRCREDLDRLKKDFRRGALSREEYESRIDSPGCRDINAGEFHVFLANQLGILKKGLVADITRGVEVWNQPVYAYKSSVIRDSDEVRDDATPGTVRELTLVTTIFYSIETPRQWNAHLGQDRGDKRDYSYRLELDGDGQIIGGSWLSQERPDFVWTHEMAAMDGDFADISEIYQRSIAGYARKDGTRTSLVP